jgi:imidazolonepropionase-like amidohydrolase
VNSRATIIAKTVIILNIGYSSGRIGICLCSLRPDLSHDAPNRSALYGITIFWPPIDVKKIRTVAKQSRLAGAQRIVRANLDRHVDLIKVFATNRAHFLNVDPCGRALSNEQLVAAVAEARNAGVPVAVHAYGDDGVAASVRAGVSSVEHGVYLTDATLELMKKGNVFFVPTISAFPPPGQTESQLSFLAATLVPPASLFCQVLRLRSYAAEGGDVMAARNKDMAVSVRDASRRAHKMGLRVLAGTDGGGSIGDEIVELAGIGMTPMEAIQAATSRCAEALGISKRTGSIQPGMEADLVVLNGNPLEDIKAVTNVVLVVNDGRIAANRLPAKKNTLS